jgi:LPXTG-motif cell wall-anchored protein
LQSEISETTKRIIPKQNTAVVMFTALLVLAVMLATAGLLLKFKRKE